MLLRKPRRAHRLAWLYVHGHLPFGSIDHINGIRSDNRLCNIRIATKSENNQNLKKAQKNNKSTGLLGAFYNKRANCFISQIVINRKQIFVGRFKTKEYAHNAYIQAKRNLHPFGML
jgi:hypothetical protein